MTYFASVKGRDLLPGVSAASGVPKGGRQSNKHETRVGSVSGLRPMVVVVATVVVVAGCVQRGACVPSGDRDKRDIIDDRVQWYLMQYGYLPASDMETGNLRTERQLREAIKTMQRFGHIPMTGELDAATRRLLRTPRCSLPDVMPGEGNDFRIRVRRFVKQGKKWDKLNLTWGVRRYPTKMRDSTGDPEHMYRWEIQREFRLATEVWGRVSRLEFTELESKPEEADIIIDFNTGYHGDGYPFDGQGRTLAHAFYPGHGIGGDMHFDDDEPWVQHQDSDNTWERVSLFITAAHELGHALGLYHSDVEGSLMSPYLIRFPSSFRLPQDDVRGIQELYGVDEKYKEDPWPSTSTTTTTTTPRPAATPRPPPRPPKSDKPDTCNTEYDAISVIRREIYIFKGKYFWRVDAQGNLLPNYPAKINRFWSKLPKNLTHIDAVYERMTDGKIVFFIGNKYYVCRGNQELLKVGRLKNLGLPATLKKIDAAFVWGYNGRTYLFAETMYWRFDEAIQHVELDYPRAMDMWRGVPYNIDSAFKHNGTTYFFQGKMFWEFDDFRMRVKPKSPALSAPFWLGCPNIKNPYYPKTTIETQATTASATPPSHPTTVTLLMCAVFLICFGVV
ncbi:matrix metalloproteinase-2-like [Portunus trituberculatus]|uniref:matrix metalloproteinase-2-like n=1 Tax=Portunus trituberculatus TaxID=210409 RepID=UPI001E1CD9D6|nr:matrix metalloproteinase-2-like [Portunus trituberculatus]